MEGRGGERRGVEGGLGEEGEGEATEVVVMVLLATMKELEGGIKAEWGEGEEKVVEGVVVALAARIEG